MCGLSLSLSTCHSPSLPSLPPSLFFSWKEQYSRAGAWGNRFWDKDLHSSCLMRGLSGQHPQGKGRRQIGQKWEGVMLEPERSFRTVSNWGKESESLDLVSSNHWLEAAPVEDMELFLKRQLGIGEAQDSTMSTETNLPNSGQLGERVFHSQKLGCI